MAQYVGLGTWATRWEKYETGITRRPSRTRPPGKWMAKFENLWIRRAMVLAYMLIMAVHNPMRNNYKRKYGQRKSSSAEYLDSSGKDITHTPDRQDPEVKGGSPTWHWKDFPWIPNWLIWVRWVTTFYMLYVAIKNIFPSLLEVPLSQLNLSKPAHCYLVGRFVPEVSGRRAMASLFALYHLAWRFSQYYTPRHNYMISTLYFLMLDDSDIENYYKLLERLRRFGGEMFSPNESTYLVDIRESSEIEAAKQVKMFHDIMSVRVDQRNRLVYKLRPNRTPKANSLLRGYFTKVTLIAFAHLHVCWLIIGLIMLFTGYRTDRYLRDYSGCSVELEKLYDNNQLDGWMIHVRGHQIMATLADFFENCVLWIECGLNIMFYVPLSMLLDYDLILYWQHLDSKTARLLEGLRDFTWLPTRQIAAERDRQIYELQMGWQDFIKQIRRADALIGDALTLSIVVWFSQLGTFTHDLMRARDSNLSLVMYVTLTVVMCNVTALSLSLLVLHRYCLSSYTRYCSLMAYDCSVHKLKFIEIMDYFTRKRTCYTLCRSQKMSTTTYLTLIGWSFSCFFVIGSMHKG